MAAKRKTHTSGENEKAIIRTLLTAARPTIYSLARKLKLQASTVQKALRRLEKFRYVRRAATERWRNNVTRIEWQVTLKGLVRSLAEAFEASEEEARSEVFHDLENANVSETAKAMFPIELGRYLREESRLGDDRYVQLLTRTGYSVYLSRILPYENTVRELSKPSKRKKSRLLEPLPQRLKEQLTSPTLKDLGRMERILADDFQTEFLLALHKCDVTLVPIRAAIPPRLGGILRERIQESETSLATLRSCVNWMDGTFDPKISEEAIAEMKQRPTRISR